jgi:UrcA family protein
MSTQADSYSRRITSLTRAMRFAVGTAAIIAALGTPAAHAAADAAPTIVVRYGELNLESDSGSQALLRRLSAAAHRVCGHGNTRELRLIVIEQNCFREAVSRAVLAVRNERLTTLYRAQTGAGAS